jgi:hypothetical protein
MSRMHQVWVSLFIAIISTVMPVVLAAQSENNDPCKVADPFWDRGSDPVYSDAIELGRTLSARGFVVECIRSSKEQHSFQGQKGAAWFRTDHGTFDVLFLPKGQNWDALEVIEQPQQNGRYTYAFRGTPQTGNGNDSSKPMWFIKYKNVLFSVWADKELAARLQKAFQNP